MKGKIRIKDIAQKVGVSGGTVDRVLHNRGEVSIETIPKKDLMPIDIITKENIMYYGV